MTLLRFFHVDLPCPASSGPCPACQMCPDVLSNVRGSVSEYIHSIIWTTWWPIGNPMRSWKFMIFIGKWSVGSRFGNVFRGIRRPGACVRSWKRLPVTRNALHATLDDWQRCVCAHIIIRNQRKLIKINENLWKSMKIYENILIIPLKVADGWRFQDGVAELSWYNPLVNREISRWSR